MPDKALDFDSDLTFALNGAPFTGIAYEESPSLGLSEIEYRDGVQEGVARDWWPSGVLKGESEHVRNTLHGASRGYDDSGRLRVVANYEYGVLVRKESFGSDGSLIGVEQLDPDSGAATLLSRYRALYEWPL